MWQVIASEKLKLVIERERASPMQNQHTLKLSVGAFI
jgi:hypothetical protein